MNVRVPRTLRARIAAAAAVSILAAVVLFGVITVVLVDHDLRSSLDSALRERAEDVAQLAVSAPAVLDDPGALESPVSGRQIDVEVLDAHGRIVARSLSLGDRLLPQDALTRSALTRGATGAQDIEVDGRPLRLYVAPIADAGGPAQGGAVLVASDTSDIAHTVSSLEAGVVLSGVIIVLLAALAAAMFTRRGLRPLRALADAAGEIERTADPSHRLPAVDTRDEIGQLTGVLNRMLSSLEQARAGERRFLADASHELRTPVTALLGNVDYASRHGVDAEVLADLRHDADRLARLVDSLLALERAAAVSGGSGSISAAVALDAVVREAVTAAAGGDRIIVGEIAPGLSVRGDEDALRRAVANLIENGLVHGPEAGLVTVGVAVVPGVVDNGGRRVAITVSDAGPGPDPASVDRLFQRFWRGPDAAGRPGAGLGLSIVAAIAEGHGGRVLVDGSAFTLELPLDA